MDQRRSHGSRHFDFDWLQGFDPANPQTGYKAELFLKAAAAIFLETIEPDVDPIVVAKSFQIKIIRANGKS